MVIAALTGQAIIPFGHRQDLADKLNLLAETSEKINRMGTEVQWCNLTWIARTNFKHRVSGTTLQLKVYSRYIEVQLPAEIVTVEVSGLAPTGAIRRGIANARQQGILDSNRRRKNFISAREWAGTSIEIRSVALGLVDYRQIELQPLYPWNPASATHRGQR